MKLREKHVSMHEVGFPHDILKEYDPTYDETRLG